MGVSFNPAIQVVYPDGAILVRQMNLDGGFYDAEMDVYDDDCESLDLGREDDEDGNTFWDAVQDQIQVDDGLFPMSLGTDDETYFQSFRLVLWLACDDIIYSDPHLNYSFSVFHSDMNASMKFEDAFQLPFDDVGLNNISDGSFTVREIMQQNSVANLIDPNGGVDVTANAAAGLTSMDSGSGAYLGTTLLNKIKNFWKSSDDDDANNTHINQNNVPTLQSPEEGTNATNNLGSASNHSSRNLMMGFVGPKSPA